MLTETWPEYISNNFSADPCSMKAKPTQVMQHKYLVSSEKSLDSL